MLVHVTRSSMFPANSIQRRPNDYPLQVLYVLYQFHQFPVTDFDNFFSVLLTHSPTIAAIGSFLYSLAALGRDDG